MTHRAQLQIYKRCGIDASEIADSGFGGAHRLMYIRRKDLSDEIRSVLYGSLFGYIDLGHGAYPESAIFADIIPEVQRRDLKTIAVHRRSRLSSGNDKRQSPDERVAVVLYHCTGKSILLKKPHPCLRLKIGSVRSIRREYITEL